MKMEQDFFNNEGYKKAVQGDPDCYFCGTGDALNDMVVKKDNEYLTVYACDECYDERTKKEEL
jgi:superfamily II helicase